VLNGKRIFVVMPAYNAARTLRRTCAELPRDIIGEVLIVDDRSSDSTVELARELGLTTFVHHQNLGYGRNQKTCYREALRRGAGHQVKCCSGRSNRDEAIRAYGGAFGLRFVERGSIVQPTIDDR
jgi:glycosyltransferase involved in cell wall biosynthesis